MNERCHMIDTILWDCVLSLETQELGVRCSVFSLWRLFTSFSFSCIKRGRERYSIGSEASGFGSEVKSTDLGHLNMQISYWEMAQYVYVYRDFSARPRSK